MTAFTTLLEEKVTLSGGTGGSWTGAHAKVADSKIFLANGTGLNEAEDGHHSSRNLVASADVDIDLQTEVGAYGAPIALQSLVYLLIEAAPTNVGNLEVTPGAASGWFGVNAFFKIVSDTVILPPGGSVRVKLLAATAYAVAAGTKTVNILNLDGSNAADFTVTIIGRK